MVFSRDAISHIQKILTVIGLFAGFGFTGLSSVSSRSLFMTGEAILLGAILIGIVGVEEYYEQNMDFMHWYEAEVKRTYGALIEAMSKVRQVAYSSNDPDNIIIDPDLLREN